MRTFVFFDLPRDTPLQRHNANKFVKGLKKQGFIMLQESVYCKLILNATCVESERLKIKKIKPEDGNILLLTITEKQFNDMELLLGKTSDKIIFSTERAVFI